MSSTAAATVPPVSTFKLTQDQIDFFFREGYLTIDALTTQEDVAVLRESYDRIFRERAGRDEGNEFDLAGTDEEGKEAALPQILGPARYAPEMNDSLLLANARAMVKQLLGASADAGFAHAIFKPARSGAETPWHQDAAYWSPSVIHFGVSIWVPLQEATPENGCMEFVPHSHELDVLQHQSINNDPRIHGLELHASEMHHVKNVAVCPLKAGGCTIHGGYMLHHTAPNHSAIPRRALILMGNGKPAEPRATPLVFPWMDAKVTARTVRAQQKAKEQEAAKTAAEKA